MPHNPEFEAVTGAVDCLLAVPKAEILRREYRQPADLSPGKRGQKPKGRC